MPKTENKCRKIVGRPKSYTAKTLAKAVNRYFSSISREKELYEKLPDGVDANGKQKFKYERIINALGEPATEIEYFIKPSVAGLCTFLGIHRATWNNYTHDEEYAAICAAACGEIEAYLCSQLGNGKGDSGIIFNLTHNYGWKNRIELEAGEETRRTISHIPQTMDEKIKFLREHGYDIPGAGDDDNAEDDA